MRLQLLGRFVAGSEGASPRVVQISAPRHRGLLAYLAMHPAQAETRERLATLLWSDRSEKQARQGLRQLLLTLRQELAAAGFHPLRVDRDMVALDPALISVDARELLALAQSEAPGPKLYEIAFGTFLDGLTVESEAFEEWLRAERLRLDAAAAGLFRRYVEKEDVAGNGALALHAAERLVALDPVAEAPQRMLLALLAKYRGPQAALAQGQSFLTQLREEIGAGPEPETAALIAGLRDAAQEMPVQTRSRAADPPLETPTLAAPAEVDVGAPDETQAADPIVAPRRRVWSRAAWGLAAVVLLGALAATTYLVLSPPPEGNPQPAAIATVRPDDWRSPSILAGVSADAPALAAQGTYPVIVLPFTAGGDAPEERLAERMTDDLTSDLSRVPSLRVIARATARIYADRPVDVAVVGAELGVRYVVEGNVRLQDGQLRINVSLIDVASRLQVWSKRFERPATERLDAQDEIVRSIARHLNINVFSVEERRRGPPRAGDPAIEELLAKGWNGIIRFFELGTTSGADGYFAEVLRRQPNNMSATLGLAGYKIGTVAQFLLPEREPHLSEADQLVARALKANPRSHMGNYYRGLLHKMRGEPSEALAQFTKVLELNPSFAPAYANAGHVMSRAGRLDEALEHVRYAMRLSPKDPNFGNWSLYAGEIELERGRDAAAMEWLKRAAELHPRTPFNHAALAGALALQGDRAGAERHATRLREIAPWLTLEVMLERLSSTSDGAAPHRLMEGLRKAFAGTQ
jgi:TolB-like protein/DNA-binding SARP family transcriptional activator/Tfp pilus assembly protein PilF